MQLSLALSALLTLFTGVSLAIPSPTRNVVNLSKRDISDGASGAAYTGRLYEPEQGITLNIGQHLNVAYDTSFPSASSSPSSSIQSLTAEPHYPSSTIGVDFGLQGPGPISVNSNNFFPYGIVEARFPPHAPHFVLR
jgi:hypothetical protein